MEAWVRIPLLPAVVLTKAGRPCVYSRKVWKYCESTFSLAATRSAKDVRVIQDALSSPTDESFLLRQGNSFLFLGPHPSCVIYWLLEVPLLTIWVNSVLICSFQIHLRLVVTATQPQALTLLGSGLSYVKRIRLQLLAESASGRTIPSRSDPWSTCSVGSVAERSKALD